MASPSSQPQITSVADLVSQYKSNVGDLAEGFRPLDPNVVNKITSGGYLAGALGYNSPKDVLGLTPDEFQQSMKTYQDPFTIIQRAGQTNDFLTGNSKIAQARINAENVALPLQAHSFDRELDRAHADELQNRKLGFESRSQDKRYDFERAQKALDIEQHKLDRLQRGAAHADTIRMQQARLDLEAKKQIALAKYAADAAISEAGSIKNDTGLYNAYTNDMAKYRGKDPTAALDAINRRPWVTTKLKRDALGNQIGAVQDTKDFATDLGWSKVMLTKVGWYGVEPDANGQITMNSKRSAQPIVPFGDVSGKSGGRSGNQYLENLYGE